MSKAKDKPTQALSPEARAWLTHVKSSFVLERHHEQLATMVAETLDRRAEARRTIQQDGPYITDRKGTLIAHPAVRVEKETTVLIARLIRQLGLDEAAGDDEAPRLPSMTGRAKRCRA